MVFKCHKIHTTLLSLSSISIRFNLEYITSTELWKLTPQTKIQYWVITKSKKKKIHCFRILLYFIQNEHLTSQIAISLSTGDQTFSFTKVLLYIKKICNFWKFLLVPHLCMVGRKEIFPSPHNLNNFFYYIEFCDVQSSSSFI